MKVQYLIMIFLLALLFVPVGAGAVDISTLLKAVERQPQARIDEIAIEEAETAVKKAYAPLYPKVSAISDPCLPLRWTSRQANRSHFQEISFVMACRRVCLFSSKKYLIMQNSSRPWHGKAGSRGG